MEDSSQFLEDGPQFMDDSPLDVKGRPHIMRDNPHVIEDSIHIMEESLHAMEDSHPMMDQSLLVMQTTSHGMGNSHQLTMSKRENPSNNGSRSLAFIDEKKETQFLNGLSLFRREFHQKNKVKGLTGKERLRHSEVLSAWNALPEAEQGSYRLRAKRTRDSIYASRGPTKANPPAFQTRCSPRIFGEVVRSFDEDQKAEVTSMGFGELLKIDCPLLGRELCEELVRRLDPRTKQLQIGVANIEITEEDVGTVLGIPCGGEDVPSGGVDTSNIVKQFRDKSLKDLRNILSKERKGILFRRAFLLFALVSLLCPTTKLGPSPRHFPAVVDVENPKKYNWAKLVFEWLLNEIHTYKNLDGKRKIGADSLSNTKKGLGGCLFFLKIYYFEKFPVGARPVDPASPIEFWSAEKIRERLQMEMIAKKDSSSEGLLSNTAKSAREGINNFPIISTYKYEATKALAYKLYSDLHQRLLKLDSGPDDCQDIQFDSRGNMIREDDLNEDDDY